MARGALLLAQTFRSDHILADQSSTGGPITGYFGQDLGQWSGCLTDRSADPRADAGLARRFQEPVPGTPGAARPHRRRRLPGRPVVKRRGEEQAISNCRATLSFCEGSSIFLCSAREFCRMLWIKNRSLKSAAQF